MSVYLSICSMFWEFAMTVYVDEIVYIHCHQQRKWLFYEHNSNYYTLYRICWL